MRYSAIIPCYNASATLAACLHSLCDQDFAGEEFESVGVDDCSTDNSRAIAAEFGAGRVQLCNSQNLPDWVSRSPVIPLAPMIWEGDDVLIRLTRPIMINPLTREGVEVEASVGQTLQRAWSEKVSTLRECA